MVDEKICVDSTIYPKPDDLPILQILKLFDIPVSKICPRHIGERIIYDGSSGW